MAKRRRSEGKPDQGSRETTPKLPAGVKLLRTLEGHESYVFSVSFDPSGRVLASGSGDKTIKLWDPAKGRLLRTWKGHRQDVWAVTFHPTGRILASGGRDGKIILREVATNKLLHTLEGGWGAIWSVAFDPKGRILASGGDEQVVKLWDPTSGRLLETLREHRDAVTSITFDPSGQMLASGGRDGKIMLREAATNNVLRTMEGDSRGIWSIVFDPAGRILASGGARNTVNVWEVASGKLLHSLEGHLDSVEVVAFSGDGRLLASKSGDGTVRIWDCGTWETVAVVPEQTDPVWLPDMAFHPALPLLATAGSEPNTPEDQRGRLIHLWELDLDLLLGKPTEAVHHTTAKIVLVGDHSVGKSALGYRMIHGRFKDQASTHGQQFWVFPALAHRRGDGTDCEAILWDFAGQPDYRLVHALFVDDADLALVLFDASDIKDPLHGVGFWLSQLRAGPNRCPIILVGAQSDRGSCAMTPEELKAFCRKNDVGGPIHTSAFTGTGVSELIERMKAMIPWDDKPATVTTTTFKRIKDYVLGLKGTRAQAPRIVTAEELRVRLQATDAAWSFTDAEMRTAVGHLENYGYVKKLRTSKGEERVLLKPELLNNLASSFVREARGNEKGLGALEEKRLLSGGYAFPELARLADDERAILLDAAALLFLKHNVCYRETDPLRMESYLVLPELINLKKPTEEEKTTEDGVAYTVTGPTENVFASLVVLLGYTHTFTRTNQWQNNARYEVGDGLVCGFRQEVERDGELDFVLYFGPKVGPPVRTLFQSLFESFLTRRNLTVIRNEPVRCTNPNCGHWLDRSVIRQRGKEGKTFACCNECGEKLTLPKVAEPIQLTRKVQAQVEVQCRAAEQRTRFEQAIYRVQIYVTEQKMEVPECFISYAWGVQDHERWVEKSLAQDLQKAGISVLLDRWHNPPGSSVGRFVDRLEKCDRIIPVGTRLYRQKYENRGTEKGTVVAAECDQISVRMRGTEKQKRTVVPILCEADLSESLPPCLQDQVFCDFRQQEDYFIAAFGLILSLYGIAPNDPAVTDLRESLSGPRMGKAD